MGDYDIEFDDGKLMIKDLKTQYMQIYNGKYGGGGIMLNPLGLINDGLMELVFYKEMITTQEAVKLFLTPGGCMFYNHMFRCFKCSKIKLINKQKTADGQMIEQDINIDGEDLTFKKFAKYEVLKEQLEIIVDFKYLFDSAYDPALF